MDIWGAKKNLESGNQYCAQIGPLTLWLKHHFDEIHVATERIESKFDSIGDMTFCIADENVNELLDWKRWIVGENSNSISILPAMPDRSIVVRPETPVIIPEGNEALFYVSIPTWVKVSSCNATEIVLCKEPSVMLSNIWFGDLMSGELCYSLPTRARREIVDTKSKPHSAVCPVHILNTSKSQLAVEGLCIHVDYLNIYRGAKRLWTNEVRIDFRGKDVTCKTDYAQKQPGYEQIDKMISNAAKPWEKKLLKKSLGRFKLSTGI